MKRAPLAVLLALCVCASPARADDTAAEARAHYQKATSFFAVGQFARAGEEYETAYTIKPDPALLFNAAQSQRLAGNNEKALILYRNYLNLYPRSRNSDDVRTQIGKLEEAIQAAEEAKKSKPAGIVEATPAPVPAPTPAPPPERPTPVYKKWWFWTALAGAAVVVGAAVTVAVVVTRDTPSWSDVADVGPGARGALTLGVHF
jgi:tetratricopeptide (TPR) repeat protein